MSALFASAGIVAIAEIGDKTQLLSLVLAARFRRPLPIITGILIATLLNHALAAWVGEWVAMQLGPQLLRWLLGASFIAIGLWALKPDTIETGAGERGQFGVFLTALVAFFLAEIGDKTQLATIALAANYNALVAVVIGTTLGMMIANVPVVLAGDRLLRRIPLKTMRWVAAGMFVILGAMILLGITGSDPVAVKH